MKIIKMILLMIMVIISLPFSCKNINNTHTSEYKTFYFEKYDIRFRLGGIVLEHPLFTFEYPTSFSLYDLNKAPEIVRYNGNMTEINFNNESQDEDGDSFFYIGVYKPGFRDIYNADELKASEISTIENGNNTKIIVNKTSSILIGGQEAEFNDYTYQHLITKELRNVKMVVLDYKGFIWEIHWNSNEQESLYPEIETYFQHLIDTFRFTDQKPEVDPNQTIDKNIIIVD